MRGLPGILLVPVLAAWSGFRCSPPPADDRIASAIIDPAVHTISMHWKDDRGNVIGNIGRLRTLLDTGQRAMVMAMNGGMFMEDRTPLGLYVENGRVLHALNTRQNATGNFYLQPNGVFGITNDGRGFLCRTADYASVKDVRYATQSGPMLLAGGAINVHFTPGSDNLNIRNGVGIRPDGRLVFAISKAAVNFHDFASFFLAQGCTDALYFDGFVSRAFLPQQGVEQFDGELGMLIAARRRGP